MANIDDLLAAVTEEDGINPEFLEAVRKAYDDDMGGHLTSIAGLEGQLTDVAAAHAVELDQLKASFFDKIMSGETVASVDADDVDNGDEDESPIYEEN